MDNKSQVAYLTGRGATEQNAIIKDLIEWTLDCCDWGDENSYSPVQHLETTNCASCHAPGGLIYNYDLARKYVDWWSEIDQALDEFHDATGDWFAPETTGQLVWFAVEWFANELARGVEDCA